MNQEQRQRNEEEGGQIKGARARLLPGGEIEEGEYRGCDQQGPPGADPAERGESGQGIEQDQEEGGGQDMGVEPHDARLERWDRISFSHRSG